MECERIRKLLSAYLDGELSEEERKEVRKHLFVCSRCELEFMKIRNMKGLIIQFGQSFEPKVDYGIHYEAFQSQINGRRLKEILLFSVLACIIILLLFFFSLFIKTLYQDRILMHRLGRYIAILPAIAMTCPKTQGESWLIF